MLYAGNFKRVDVSRDNDDESEYSLLRKFSNEVTVSRALHGKGALPMQKKE